MSFLEPNMKLPKYLFYDESFVAQAFFSSNESNLWLATPEKKQDLTPVLLHVHSQALIHTHALQCRYTLSCMYTHRHLYPLTLYGVVTPSLACTLTGAYTHSRVTVSLHPLLHVHSQALIHTHA